MKPWRRFAQKKAKARLGTPVKPVDLTERAREGVGQAAEQLVRGALGAAGISTLAILAVSSLYPLMASGFTPVAVAAWLGGLGGNALAGWLASWAERVGGRVVWEGKIDNRALLEQMAIDFQQHIADDTEFSDEVTALLEHVDAISTAISALAVQGDVQTDLLRNQESQMRAQSLLVQALHTDLRQHNIIQGRLHRLLSGELDGHTRTILTAYEQGTMMILHAVNSVQASVQTLHRFQEERDEARRALILTQQAEEEARNALEEARDALAEYLCPFCGAKLISREYYPELIWYDGREMDNERERVVYDCGYTVMDNREETPCPSTRSRETKAKRTLDDFLSS